MGRQRSCGFARQRRTRTPLAGAGALAAALLLLPAPAAGQPPAEAGAEEVTVGNRLFDIHCARCHGLGGVGGEGPNLMRENLRRTASDDDALLRIIDNGVPGTDMPGGHSLNTHEIRALGAYVRTLGVVAREELPGDPTVGKELYDGTMCGSCHIVNGEGMAFGPDLSDIGLLRGSVHLRESVTSPEAFVSPHYRTVLVEDAGGAQVMGLRVNEDTFSIQLLDQAGRLRSFRKNEIRSFQLLPEESLMMVYGAFTESELDDLVAYLASLRGDEGEPRE